MSDARYRCPHCGQVFEGSAGDAGSEADCPSCGKAFRLEPVAGTVAKKRPSPIRLYFGCFGKYCKFRGRACRREFWWAFAFNMLAGAIVAFLDTLFSGPDGGVIAGIFLLATFLPMLAVHVRRLHDTNKSAWWILLFLLPVLNIAYIVWLATDGDKGKNRFGPDPKRG